MKTYLIYRYKYTSVKNWRFFQQMQVVSAFPPKYESCISQQKSLMKNFQIVKILLKSWNWAWTNQSGSQPCGQWMEWMDEYNKFYVLLNPCRRRLERHKLNTSHGGGWNPQIEMKTTESGFGFNNNIIYPSNVASTTNVNKSKQNYWHIWSISACKIH